MTKTKNCPACQKELPLLAVRCKYCGFKLSNRPAQVEEAPPPRPSAPPPPPPARTSAPPPPPPKRASVPPQPVRSQNRTMTLGSLSAPARPIGFGQSAPKGTAQDRSTLPPPPVARSSKPEIAAPPAAPVVEEELDLSTDVEEWLPGPEEIGDDTGLLDLDAEEIEEILPDRAAGAGAALPVEDDLEPDAAAPGMFLLRYVLGDEQLDGFEAKGWPAGLVKILGKVRFAHLIGAGVVLIGLIVLIVAIAAGGSDEPEVVAAAPPAAAAPAGKPAAPDQAVPASPKTGKPAAPSAPTAPAPTPAAEQPAAAVPAAGTSCRALGEYPTFPWKDRLAGVLGKLGAAGICGLLGSGASQVAAAFEGTPMVGPGGYDLIAGGGLLDLFPGGKADRRAPSIELLFVGDKLFEVRLKYRDTVGKDLEEKALAAVFEEGEKLKDHLGRKVTRHLDGDVVIELLEEKWYGRTLRTLVFASQPIRAALESGRAAREAAEVALNDGDALLAKRKFDEAGAKYRDAEKLVPSFGLAFVKQTLLLIHEEKFDDVPAMAGKVLAVSREPSVRAQAHGMLGVAALFGGDKARAIAEYQAAAVDDPAQSLFSMSVAELETGKYDTARVALTAARMECLKRKKSSYTFEGLRARGNFPSMKDYFDVMRVAKKDPKFDQLQKQWVKMECR